MYESADEPLIERASFIKRLLRHGAVIVGVVGGSLVFGAVGFYAFGGLNWLDAFVNSAMMLTTMGPIDAIDTTVGKLFMTFFAFYSQLVFLVVVGVLLAPIVHRLLHSFHLGQGGG